MRGKVRALWVIAAAVVTVVLGGAVPVRAQGGPGTVMDGQWHFIAAPYFWFAGLKGNVSVKGVVDIPIDESFSDVFSNFHFGFLGHFEGRKDRFGFATDIMYMDLHVPVAARAAPVLGQLGLDTTVKSTTVEGRAFYRVASGGRKDNPAGLDVLVGARYYGTSAQLNATLPGGADPSSGKENVLVGGRSRRPPLPRAPGLAGRLHRPWRHRRPGLEVHLERRGRPRGPSLRALDVRCRLAPHVDRLRQGRDGSPALQRWPTTGRASGSPMPGSRRPKRS